MLGLALALLVAGCDTAHQYSLTYKVWNRDASPSCQPAQEPCLWMLRLSLIHELTSGAHGSSQSGGSHGFQLPVRSREGDLRPSRKVGDASRHILPPQQAEELTACATLDQVLQHVLMISQIQITPLRRRV